MVKLSIPKTYLIIQKGNNSVVARSPDNLLSIFFAKQSLSSSQSDQAEFIDRAIAELHTEVTDLKRLTLEPPDRILNGIPMLQVAIAGKIDGREVKVGLFMLEMRECILFMMATIDNSNFKQKQKELLQIFNSIQDPDLK
jgi:hypothetical protein